MEAKPFYMNCRALALNRGHVRDFVAAPHYLWQGNDWSVILYTAGSDSNTGASLSVRMPWDNIGRLIRCDFATAWAIIENIVK